MLHYNHIKIKKTNLKHEHEHPGKWSEKCNLSVGNGNTPSSQMMTHSANGLNKNGLGGTVLLHTVKQIHFLTVRLFTYFFSHLNLD